MGVKLVFLTTLLILFLQTLYSSYYLYIGHKISSKKFPASASFGEKSNPTLKLFITGDSVAAGVGATTFENSVSGRIARYLAQNHYILFQNEAESGAKMESVLKLPLPKEKQDLLIIIASSNDLFKFTNPNKFKKSAEETVGLYAENATKLIVVGPGRVFDGEALPIPA